MSVRPTQTTVDLAPLIEGLVGVFDGNLEIEARARAALAGVGSAQVQLTPIALPDVMRRTLMDTNAHPLCAALCDKIPLPWAPPETSSDAAYAAHSIGKLHVELLGPDGLIRSDQVRLGLYGYVPGVAYGLRQHPAEEVFIMMAGSAEWARGGLGYTQLVPGERSHHPSMMSHATRSTDSAFMSAFVWVGDLGTEHYTYSGQAHADQP